MNTKKNTTVIYVTNSVEDEKFESKVQKLISENCGDLPIISVSRKPIKFGRNIYVGKAPLCRSSTLKMLLKGLEFAKTRYAVVAEADCLYPPEYFSFIPPKNNLAYYYGNVWTVKDRFWKKRFLDGALTCNREYWIKMIKTALKGQKGWEVFNAPAVFPKADTVSWNPKNPVVRMITPQSTNKYGNIHRRVSPLSEVPYWGKVIELKKKMIA